MERRDEKRREMRLAKDKDKEKERDKGNSFGMGEWPCI